MLALDAARYGDLGLSARITAVSVDGGADRRWGVDWATGSTVDRRFRQALIGHTERMRGVATGVVDGRSVVVTFSSEDRTVRVWDLASGRLVGEPLAGHVNGVWAVVTGVVEGCPVAVTGGNEDGEVRVWDLSPCRPVGEPRTGHTDEVRAVATAVVDGRPVAVGGSRDGTVRGWDLATGRPAAEPVISHSHSSMSVTTAVLDGRPVVLTSSWEGVVWVWDLTTGRPVGEPLVGHTGPVWSPATGAVEGTPVIAAGGVDGTVWVWDLTTGRPIGEPLTGHYGLVSSVAIAVVEGRPVAVTGSWDTTVRVWDLATRRPVGEPLTGHTDEVRAVATGVVGGRPVAVTGSLDGMVQVWDLSSGRPAGSWCSPGRSVRWRSPRTADWSWASAGRSRSWPHPNPEESTDESVADAPTERAPSWSRRRPFRLVNRRGGGQLKAVVGRRKTAQVQVAWASSPASIPSHAAASLCPGVGEPVLSICLQAGKITGHSVASRYTPPTADSVKDRPTESTRKPAASPPSGVTSWTEAIVALSTRLRRSSGTVSYVTVAMMGLSTPKARPSTAMVRASGAKVSVQAATTKRGRHRTLRSAGRDRRHHQAPHGRARAGARRSTPGRGPW